MSSSSKSSSRKSSKKSSSRNTSKHSMTSLERRQKKAIETFEKLPHRSPIDIGRENRKAAAESKRQNNSELLHINFQVRIFFKPIVRIIRSQLREIGSLIYNIEYTNKYTVPWTRRDLPLLEKVKQSLMNALQFIIYPKEKHAALYNHNVQIVYTRNELIQVNPFFEPVIKEIQKSLNAISSVIYKKLYPRNGKLYEYEKPFITLLQESKQQLLDLFNSLPYMGMSIRLVNDHT